VARLQNLQAFDKMRADAQGGVAAIALLAGLQKRPDPRRKQRVCPKRAEKFIPLLNELAILRRRANRRQRKTIADRFAKHDDVGNHALRFEPQKAFQDARIPTCTSGKNALLRARDGPRNANHLRNAAYAENAAAP